MEATTVRTCPGKPGPDRTRTPSGPPKTCGAGWVERSEGRLTINCTKDIYGNGTPWFRVTEGSHPGWFVKSDHRGSLRTQARRLLMPTTNQRRTKRNSTAGGTCKFHPEQKRTNP